ncbi:hypothetical protein UPYG_G00282080 [Umbra pygmaea]|uniref:Uncharacterized protein n=1 Tax=Umbra pygmaea TaxID=75934 RepID=A0ABD0W7M7_UMBPY
MSIMSDLDESSTSEVIALDNSPPCTPGTSIYSQLTPRQNSSRCSFDTEESASLNNTPGSDWHYNFEIPWSKMSSSIRKKLLKKERPTGAERREVIRIIGAEILEVCKRPGKKHINEVARKMVIAYPKSFRDEIENEIVGSGYDSIVKQLSCRIENYKRKDTPSLKRRVGPSSSDSEDNSRKDNSKRQQKDYGCINSEPQLPPGETLDLQKQKKEELVKMSGNKEKNKKKIEKLMTDTYVSQRKDIMMGKDTDKLTEEWPYLFQTVGMRIHFSQLTGVNISDTFQEATASKFRRILEYFHFISTEPSSRAGKLLFQTDLEVIVPVELCSCFSLTSKNRKKKCLYK